MLTMQQIEYAQQSHTSRMVPLHHTRGVAKFGEDFIFSTVRSHGKDMFPNGLVIEYDSFAWPYAEVQLSKGLFNQIAWPNFALQMLPTEFN